MCVVTPIHKVKIVNFALISMLTARLARFLYRATLCILNDNVHGYGVTRNKLHIKTATSTSHFVFLGGLFFGKGVATNGQKKDKVEAQSIRIDIIQ